MDVTNCIFRRHKHVVAINNSNEELRLILVVPEWLEGIMLSLYNFSTLNNNFRLWQSSNFFTTPHQRLKNRCFVYCNCIYPTAIKRGLTILIIEQRQLPYTITCATIKNVRWEMRYPFILRIDINHDKHSSKSNCNWYRYKVLCIL